MFESTEKADMPTAASRLAAARTIIEGAREEILEALVCCRLTSEQRELLESAEQSLDDIYLPGIIEQLELARFDQDLSVSVTAPSNWSSAR